MSGTIRINIRTLERTVWIILTIILVGLLVWQYDSGAPTNGDVDVVALQQQVTTLQTTNADLENQLAEAQADLEVIEEATEERQQATEEPAEVEAEPEPVEETLSDEIEISWTVRMDSADSDKLERVSFSIQNGYDTTERLTYAVYWEDFFDDKVRVTDTITLRSGKGETVSFLAADEGFASNPPDTVDTLILEVTDDNGDLVDQLEKVVR